MSRADRSDEGKMILIAKQWPCNNHSQMKQSKTTEKEHMKIEQQKMFEE